MLEEVAKELIIALEVCKNNLSLSLDSEMDTQKKLEESDEKLVDSLAINLRLYDKLAEANDLYEIAEEGRIHFMEQLAGVRAKLSQVEL